MQDTGFKFPLPYDLFADDEARDEALNVFAKLPKAKRERVLWAVQALAGTPASERLRFIEDLERRIMRKK